MVSSIYILYVAAYAGLCAAVTQGYVTFDANGDRLPFGHVQQYRRPTGKEVLLCECPLSVFSLNGDSPSSRYTLYFPCVGGSDLERVTFATFNGTNLVFLDDEGSVTIFPGTAVGSVCTYVHMYMHTYSRCVHV